jgi:hypothetical protein
MKKKICKQIHFTVCLLVRPLVLRGFWRVRKNTSILRRITYSWSSQCSKGNPKQLRWSRGSVLPLPKFAGSNPAKAVRIFQGKKILSTPSFRGEVKPSVPCRRFAACKRSLNVTWNLTFRQNYRPTFSPTVPHFAARISHVIWTWRCLAVEVGTSKKSRGDKGCTISL